MFENIDSPYKQIGHCKACSDTCKRCTGSLGNDCLECFHSKKYPNSESVD